MTESSDRDREIADLKARLASLEAAKASEIPPSRTSAMPKRSPAPYFIALLIVAGGFILLVVASQPGTTRSSADSSAVDASAAANLAMQAATDAANAAKGAEGSNGGPGSSGASGWRYTERGDAMHDEKTKLACVTSNNQLSLSAPYQDVDADLCIRRKPAGELDAYVQLNGDGQILCDLEGCMTHVRFDKGRIEGFPTVTAADGSSNIVFLNRTTALVSDLKRSQSTVIALNMYQAGTQELVFNTAGLKWP
jgi:hypothetical protein